MNQWEHQRGGLFGIKGKKEPFLLYNPAIYLTSFGLNLVSTNWGGGLVVRRVIFPIGT